MDTLSVTPDHPDTPEVRALLLRHHALMRASSPEDSCHVMDPDALVARGVLLLAARDGDAVLGVGALAQLNAQEGELKSMHTAHEARGRGVGRAILLALLEAGRDLGLKRISLETGAAEMFAPARALYAAQGFVECPPFGAYNHDPFSVFMTRRL